MKIDFHDEVNLDKVLLSRIVSPHWPGELCTSPSTRTTTLIYHDKSQNSQGIIWLDCAVSPPQQIKVMGFQQLKQIHEMTYTRNLLVATDGHGIQAFDSSSGQPKWSIERNMNPKALSADGRGHLFVSDSANTSIEVVSTDGNYKVCLIKAGEQGLGVPMRIRWCDTTGSLIVAHCKNKTMFLSIVGIQ